MADDYRHDTDPKVAHWTRADAADMLRHQKRDVGLRHRLTDILNIRPQKRDDHVPVLASVTWEEERQIMKERQRLVARLKQEKYKQEYDNKNGSQPRRLSSDSSNLAPLNWSKEYGPPPQPTTTDPPSETGEDTVTDVRKHSTRRQSDQLTLIEIPSDSEDAIDSGLGLSDTYSDSTDKSLSTEEKYSPIIRTEKDTIYQPKAEWFAREETEIETICSFAFFRNTKKCRSKSERPGARMRSRFDFRNSDSASTSSSQSHESDFHSHSAHVMTLYGHEAAVTQCHVTSALVITASKDGTLRIWCLETGRQIKALNYQRPIHDFRCLTDDNGLLYVIACCEDGGIVIISVDSSTPKIVTALAGEYTGHLPNPVRTLSISNDHQRLATGCCFLMNQINMNCTQEISVRGTLKVWDLGAMLAASRDNRYYDCQPLLVKTMRQMVGGVDDDGCHGMRALQYSPDNSIIMVGLGHPSDVGVHDLKMINILCAKTLTTLWSAQRYFYQITGFTFLPTEEDQRWQIIVSTQFTICKMTIGWRGQCDNQKQAYVETDWDLSCMESNCGTVSSPDGRLLVSGTGCDVSVLDATDGSDVIKVTDAHEAQITRVTVSSDCKYICCGGEDGVVRLWDVPKLVKHKAKTAP